MAKPTLPVILHLGDVTAVAEIGTVVVPLVPETGKDAAGRLHVNVRVDIAALRRDLAEVLRDAADQFDKAADGD